jgi:hypothetical protein
MIAFGQLGPLDQQAVRGAGDDRQLLERHDLFGLGVEVMDLQVLGRGAADTVTVDECVLVAVAVECLFAELDPAWFAAVPCPPGATSRQRLGLGGGYLRMSSGRLGRAGRPGRPTAAASG